MPEKHVSIPRIFALVAVDVPVPRPLTYAVPETLSPFIFPGVRVLVPLGRKRTTGYVMETAATADVSVTKEIIRLLEEEPLFGQEDLEFYRWISQYYHHPIGKTLSEIIPGRKISAKDLSRSVKAGRKDPPAVNQTASDKRKDLILSGADKTCPMLLSQKQFEAREAIVRALTTKRFSPFLLHGVTGSGKTEVYLQAMAHALDKARGIIYLVPEIALTPQLIGRLCERFPDEPLAVLHSGLTPASRYREWKMIRQGRIRVVIGARSALFAPVHNLGLIIVDEEHDTSYKQDDRLKYNARDLSLVKARIWESTVILGSATPDMQSFYNAKQKKYAYLSLPERVLKRPMPEIEIIDLKRYGRNSLLTEPLIIGLRKNLEAGKQALLFLNRRGFNTLVVCFGCGYVFRCPNCSVSLTHHWSVNGINSSSLKCHHCDYTQAIPDKCPGCQKKEIRKLGFGTERLEEELKIILPQARIRRMDSDTMSGRDAHAKILSDLDELKIDILVGTQMITKGHDFPQVTLIGVILADASLNLPDFRASERTFQLLTQVSGRGGRGETPGRVIIQTMNPNHYAVLRAQDHDYEAFYDEEIRERQALAYPPFSRLINFHLSSLKADFCRTKAQELGVMARDICRYSPEYIEIIGPAESPLEKIRGRYRWQMLLKGRETASLHELAKEILARAGGLKLKVTMDVDPINFM